MKKKWMRWMFFWAGVTAAASWNAYAEMIQGEVRSLNAAVNQVVLQSTDQPDGRDGKELVVEVSPQTAFEGLSSLQELRTGDEVRAEAVHNVQRKVWEARLVLLSKVKIRQSEGL